MKKKLMYEVPDAELIELKLEGYLMQSGDFNDNNHTEYLGSEEDGGNL